MMPPQRRFARPSRKRPASFTRTSTRPRTPRSASRRSPRPMRCSPMTTSAAAMTPCARATPLPAPRMALRASLRETPLPAWAQIPLGGASRLAAWAPTAPSAARAGAARTTPRPEATWSTSSSLTPSRPRRAAAGASPTSATSRATFATAPAPCMRTTQRPVPRVAAPVTSPLTSRASSASAS